MPVVAKQNTNENNIIPFDASTATTLPTGCRKNQKFYVKNAGTVAGITFVKNDVFYALIDNPSTKNDFGDIMPDVSTENTDTDTDFSLTFLSSIL